MKKNYASMLKAMLKWRVPVLLAACIVVLAAIVLAQRLGSEFIPHLDEGDLAVQALRIPGTSLTQSLDMQFQMEKAVLKIPEVKSFFSRVGTAEVASDPMGPNISDGYVMLKPHQEWPDSSRSKADVQNDIEEVLESLPGNAYEISQPIQLRFNELISGVRSDLGVKIYGDDSVQLLKAGKRVAEILQGIEGAESVKIEQMEGLPMLTVVPDKMAMLRYGIKLNILQDTVAAAIGGEEAGQLFSGDQRFPLVVRLPEHGRNNPAVIASLPVSLPAGGYVPLSEVAALDFTPGVNQISRENGKRRLVVSANVQGRDLGSFVAEVQNNIGKKLVLPAGYWITYGGTFEQLQSASQRLQLLVPFTLLLIFAVLMLAFSSARDAALVFSGIPLALTGGVVALWLREMPLSITAGVGFITLSGVSVLTGVMLVSAFKDGMRRGMQVEAAIIAGAELRLRPVLMVALVAALGFMPMALNTGTGAEVQRPLATVVIGGIVSSTLLTLLVLPGLYRMAHRRG